MLQYLSMTPDKPTIIVIHGAPASSKTHFSQWLSQELQLPLLSKDDIKEELYNHFDYTSIDQTKNIGAASFELLWLWLSTLMPFKQTLIIETAFFAKLSQPKIIALAHRYGYNIIQVFCQAAESVRHQRYVARANGPDRHPGHMDRERLAEFQIRTAVEYRSMDLPGSTLTLDTTDLDNLDYQNILQKIVQELNHAH